MLGEASRESEPSAPGNPGKRERAQGRGEGGAFVCALSGMIVTRIGRVEGK